MSTCLVSGLGGFLGRHLSDTLLRKGYKVAGIPRDLFTDADALTHYLIEARPDYIFHLGAYGHHFQHKDMDQMVATNIFNTYILLKLSAQLPLKKFVYCGTSSEYGLKENAMKESDALNPVGGYATTKACASLLTGCFKNTLVVRPFSMFGEGEYEWRFMPTLIKSLKSGEVMNLVPEVKHDWIYVVDAAEAMVRAAESDLTGALNIGMGKQYSNLEIVKLYEQIAGKKLNYKEVSGLRTYDTNHWVANTTRLKSIGFTPIYGVRCGLKRNYDYY